MSRLKKKKIVEELIEQRDKFGKLRALKYLMYKHKPSDIEVVFIVEL